MSYNPVQTDKEGIVRAVDVLNALGIVAFAFRGHNLTLEIQVKSQIHSFLLLIRNILINLEIQIIELD